MELKRRIEHLEARTFRSDYIAVVFWIDGPPFPTRSAPHPCGGAVLWIHRSQPLPEQPPGDPAHKVYLSAVMDLLTEDNL